ncbi:MAG: hypothetical protein WDN24_03485 [Sphingomonas sp.]
MSRPFTAIMRVLPQIMTAFAASFYLATVLVSIAVGNEFSDSFSQAVPPEYRLKSFLIVFVQPLTSVMIILFGAGLLWRLDRLIAGPAKEGAQ